MFGWLANLLIKAPVVGSSCSCCEGQKQQLKKMQKAILSGEVEDETEQSCCRGEHCGSHDQVKQYPEMTTSYHYEL